MKLGTTTNKIIIRDDYNNNTSSKTAVDSIGNGGPEIQYDDDARRWRNPSNT